jgi:hypothetical protein
VAAPPAVGCAGRPAPDWRNGGATGTPLRNLQPFGQRADTLARGAAQHDLRTHHQLIGDGGSATAPPTVRDPLPSLPPPFFLCPNSIDEQPDT